MNTNVAVLVLFVELCLSSHVTGKYNLYTNV